MPRYVKKPKTKRTMINESFPATAWNNGKWRTSGAGYGIRVSTNDRDRFFNRNWRSVTLRLVTKTGFVDVQVNCAKDSFWHGTCRELISRDIGRWFLDLKLAPWPKGRPPRFDLSPVRPGVFLVQPLEDAG